MQKKYFLVYIGLKNWFEKYRQIGKNVTPSSDFKEELRAKIYEESVKEEMTFFQQFIKNISIPKPQLVLKIEKKQPLLTIIRTKILQFFSSLWRLVFLLGGGALAVVFLVPSFVNNPIEAANPSLLKNISGSVFLTQTFSDQNRVLQTQPSEVMVGSRIETGQDASAEIAFFEGSVLRFDENTSVVVRKIAPHPFLFSSGGVHIELEKGRVWLKTFHKNTRQMGVVVITDQGDIFPSRSAMSIDLRNGKNTVMVFEHTAEIIAEGLDYSEDIQLGVNQKLSFSPFDLPLVVDILEEEKTSFWVKQNREKDEAHKIDFLSRIGKEGKEDFLLAELQQKAQLYLSQDPTPEEIQELFSDLNNALIVASVSDTEISTKQIEEITKTLKQVSDAEPVTDEILEEVKQVAKKKTVIKKLSPSFEPVPSVSPSSIPVAVLDADANITQDNNNTDNIVVNEVIVLENESEDLSAQEVYAQYKAKEKEEKLNSVTQSFVNQVEFYTYEGAKKGQAEYLLLKIKEADNAEEILKNIERSLPIKEKAVRKMVREARKEVINQNEKID